MSASDEYRLGYRRVDDDEHVSVLVGTMDTTGHWDATRALREWERRHLDLTEGARLLDIGCGPGDAALALAHDFGSSGEVVGIDVSAEMVKVAVQRSRNVLCAVRFAVGDAMALNEAEHSFDVVRSERTLQWVIDPEVAVAEMSRVLRPGGRISLIDTDWSTFNIDVGSPEVSDKVRNAMSIERNRPSHVGNRLARLLTAVGLEVLAETTATQVWNAWDPDDSPAPDGCFSMESLAEDLIDAKQLNPVDAASFVAAIHNAARQDRFAMTLTMHAVVAASPHPVTATASHI